MKVALVSEHASPLADLGGVDAGGQNVHVAELARSLAALGVEVTVHTRRDDPRLATRVPLTDGVTVEHVDAGPARPVPKDALFQYMDAFGAALQRSWMRERPDVVHSHFWMSGYAARSATTALKLPLVHTYHALGTVKRRQQGVRDTSPSERLAVECDLARRADLILATSHDERRELLGMGARSDRVHVVPCGVDLDRFHPAPPARRSGTRRVVVVSRLVERKGIGNVIEALPAVRRTNLVIAGGMPARLSERDTDRARLEALASEYGVASRVQFLGGIARSAVPNLLRSADVVACCPWYEPFGMVAVEAMACGVPVVATAVGGLAESVVNGRTGLLVPPREPAAIAMALSMLLSDPDRRDRMAVLATRRAQRYSWRQIAAETYGHLVGVARPDSLVPVGDLGEPA